MTQKTKYAIRCSTEEQARECREKWFYRVDTSSSKTMIYRIPIITYEEAQSLGLLGEKKELSRNSSELVEPQQNEVQESSSEDLVELIMKDINKWRHYDDEDGPIFDDQEAFNNGLDFSIRMIKKHLSSQESPSEDNLVEKIDSIMEEADRLSNVWAMDYWINIPRNRLREILNKHLLSK